jgi:hypothetical protein
MDTKTLKEVIRQENEERIETDAIIIPLTRGYVRGVIHGIMGTAGAITLGAALITALIAAAR